MIGPEDRPRDDEPADREEYEAWEKRHDAENELPKKTYAFTAIQIASIRNSLMPQVMGRELPVLLYYEIWAERLNVLIAVHGYRHDSPEDALQQVVNERAAQDEEWGGPGHDNEHSRFDWVKYIREHAGRSVRGLAKDDFRKQMIRVAALAVAAVQAYDRKGRCFTP